MKNYGAKNVDEWIESAPKEAQSKLNELRKIIKSTIPGAEEGISWGVPFYKYKGVLAGFTALKNHLDFGLVTVLNDEDREALEEKGYETGKKTVKIRFDQKIPSEEIKKILKEKARMNEASKKV